MPIFAGLAERALRRILDVASEFEIPAGRVLIEAGREASGMFVIEDGTVVVEAGGKKVERGPGDFVGELALLAPEGVRTARVRAAASVRGLAIARRDFLALLEAEPKIAVAMLQVLAERLARDARRG